MPHRTCVVLRWLPSLTILVLCVTFLKLCVFNADIHLRKWGQGEVTALAGLRRIQFLESQFAAAHPKEGFSCELESLRPEPAKISAYFTDRFLSTRADWAYRFTLRGCERNSFGQAVRFQITAEPIQPGKTGVRAFCTDQTGVIRFDVNSSADACLASGRVLP